MPHVPRPFYRVPLKRWYVQLRGRQIPLGSEAKPRRDKHGKPIPPQTVIDRYYELMAAKDESAAPVASDLVVAIVDRFLDWVQRRKAPRTYEWYRRHLQNFARAIPRETTIGKLRPHHVTTIIDGRESWSPSTKHAFARCVQR